MKICVCAKQVPDTAEIKINPETGTLMRAGVPSILNTFDGYALEAALRIKDDDPATEIVVVSMGPGQAEEMLREALGRGADRAYLITDRAFGGSDTIATSYIISSSIRKIEQMQGVAFDAVFCGKQAIDGDTAQVGPQIAEILGLPQITYALEAKLDGDGLQVLQEAEGAKLLLSVRFPCLVTFTKPSFEPRLGTLKRKIIAGRADIGQITASDLPDIDKSRIGLKGSPTKVRKSFVPPLKSGGIMIDEATPAACAKKLAALLHEAQAF